VLQASFACNNYYCTENKLAERLASLKQPEWIQKGCSQLKPIIWSADPEPEVKVSRNGPERRSGKRIVAGTAFRLDFQVGLH